MYHNSFGVRLWHSGVNLRDFLALSLTATKRGQTYKISHFPGVSICTLRLRCIKRTYIPSALRCAKLHRKDLTTLVGTAPLTSEPRRAEKTVGHAIKLQVAVSRD